MASLPGSGGNSRYATPFQLGERPAIAGDIPESDDDKLFMIAGLSADPPRPDDPVRKLYRTIDNRELVLAEHKGSIAVRVGPPVLRHLPKQVAAGVCMGRDRHITDPLALLTVSMGLIDAVSQIDRLQAKLVAMEARATKAEAALHEAATRPGASAAPAEPLRGVSEQGVLL